MARRGRARRIATCPHPNPPIVSGGGVRIGVPRFWAHLSCLPSFHCQVGQAPPGARPIWPRSLPSGCRSPLNGALRTGPRWAECPVIPFVSSVSRTAPPGSRRTSARLPCRALVHLSVSATQDPLPRSRVSITWLPRQAPVTTPAPRPLPGFAYIVIFEITSLSPATTGGPTLIRARFPASRSFLET